MFFEPRVNVIESNEGFSVETLGITGLRYRRGDRSLFIDIEVLFGQPVLMFYRHSIKRWDDGELVEEDERSRIIDDIRRAFRSTGDEISVYPPQP
jgi:hypothetical protein